MLVVVKVVPPIIGIGPNSSTLKPLRTVHASHTCDKSNARHRTARSSRPSLHWLLSINQSINQGRFLRAFPARQNHLQKGALELPGKVHLSEALRSLITRMCEPPPKKSYPVVQWSRLAIAVVGLWVRTSVWQIHKNFVHPG